MDREARGEVEQPRRPHEMPAYERPGLKATFASFGLIAVAVSLLAIAVIVVILIALI